MILVKETSKSGVIANINGVYGQVYQGQFLPYTESELNKKTAYREEFGWVEYNSLNDWFKMYHERKLFKVSEKVNKELKMKAIQENPHNYTALEVYECALYLNRTIKGWAGAEFLLKDTPFSKAVLDKVGSYTVTPYDDGGLLIKANGNRYGNKRGWLNIDDLLN